MSICKRCNRSVYLSTVLLIKNKKNYWVKVLVLVLLVLLVTIIIPVFWGVGVGDILLPDCACA